MRAIGGLALALFVAAAARADACNVPGNLVANCGFTSSSTGWSLVWPLLMFSSLDGSPNGSGPGCLGGQPISMQMPFFGFQQCVSGLQPNTSYGFGIDSRTLDPSVNSSCSLAVMEHPAADCNGGVLQGHSVGIALGDWAQYDGTFVSNAGVQSATFSVFCSDGALDPALKVRFDDAFLGAGLVPVELQRFELD